jgi:hypothetical protein
LTFVWRLCYTVHQAVEPIEAVRLPAGQAAVQLVRSVPDHLETGPYLILSQEAYLITLVKAQVFKYKSIEDSSPVEIGETVTVLGDRCGQETIGRYRSY